MQSSLRKFRQTYFPTGCDAEPPGWWFGARKRKHRVAVESLLSAFGGTCVELAIAVQREGAVGAAAAGRLEALDCLAGAVMLDQLGRNAAAVNYQLPDMPAAATPQECSSRFVWDRSALALATMVLQKWFGSPDSESIRLDCNIAEFCFFTLVFRHSDRAENVATAVSLLERVLAGELAAVPLDLTESNSSGRRLCERFLHESRVKATSLENEIYISQALQNDVPEFLFDPAVSDTSASAADMEGSPSLEVLDEVCRALCASSRYLQAFKPGSPDDQQSAMEPLRNHPATVAMERALRSAGIGPGSRLLLSLSGGVDSVAHAIMLRLLQPELNFTWGALHMHHLNRDDAGDEERWVERIARRLNVPLWSYLVRLQRPHGDTKTGITRERYEEATKQIRFEMYRKALASLEGQAQTDGGGGDGSCDDGSSNNSPLCAIILGHHADDADENRLAEMGKSNVINIDGMEKLSTCFGLILFRPLLALRKELMYSLAKVARAPFMRDSTPKWSRRGWTRRVLDSETEETRRTLLDLLAKLGATSARLGDLFGSAIFESSSSEVLSLAGWNVQSTLSNAPADGAAALSAALIRIPQLEQIALESAPSLKAMWRLTEEVATIWNPAIERERQRCDFTATSTTAAGTVPEELSTREAAAAEVRSCPLQPIRLHEQVLDPVIFAFVHTVKHHAIRPDILPFVGGGQVTAKAAAHIISMARKAKDASAPVWSSLNANCPCVWIPATSCLVLYPPSLTSDMTRSALCKRSFVAFCRKAASTD